VDDERVKTLTRTKVLIKNHDHMFCCLLKSRRVAIGTAAAIMILVAVIIVGAIGTVALTSSPTPNSTQIITTGSTSSAVTTSTSTGSDATFYIQVTNGSTASPLAGISVEAGPTPSPNDVMFTPGGPSLIACVHQVPNGSSVGNGTAVSNGTTITFTQCPLKGYATNASGWVSIINATGPFLFIDAGNVNEWNDVVIGVQDNSVVNMRIPLPQGNITVPTSGETCNGGFGSNITSTCTPQRYPVLWPQTTIVWPCGKGIPSGGAVTAQGFYAGVYVAYPYATFTNGTKAALLTDCDEGSL
jgi:hypothetical protein